MRGRGRVPSIRRVPHCSEATEFGVQMRPFRGVGRSRRGRRISAAVSRPPSSDDGPLTLGPRQALDLARCVARSFRSNASALASLACARASLRKDLREAVPLSC